jgi:hypothetical protein
MRVNAKYEIIKQDFLHKVALEQKKYPLSDREQMFIDAFVSLIEALQEIDVDRYY